ncbi:MAG: HWE histidine kinase domain-containing protein, partial [Pseudomonadota bacterium]
EYGEVLDARIRSLARAHDQLTESEWSWVSLKSLIKVEIEAFLSAKAARVRVEGEDVELSPTAFTTMALVVHELVTNSAKYGALSDSSGEVLVKIAMEDGAAAVLWRERNGPPVKPPTRKGFGTTIIERSIPYELKGSAEVDFDVVGLEARFTLPEAHAAKAEKGAAAEAASARPDEVAAVRIEGEALVVEDNMIIAMDACDMLSELGASMVYAANSVAEAMRILRSSDVAIAFLDVNLGDETSLAVAQECAAKGVRTVLATGYGASESVVKTFPPGPVLRKPYTIEQVREAVAAAQAGG